MSLLGLVLAGCGAEAPELATPSATPTNPVQSNSPFERFFPLKDGTLYTYDVDILSDHPSSGILTARVTRSGATSGSLQIGGTTRRITYEADGVVATEPTGDRAYLIKAPIAAGTTWNGPTGSQIRIVDPHATLTVGAGTYVECIVTQETRGGDIPKDVTTTYCPDVGIAELLVKSPARQERASLKAFGPPVDLGPEGVTHTVTPQ